MYLFLSFGCNFDATRNILEQMAEGMPQAITVTPEEREAIARVSLLY